MSQTPNVHFSPPLAPQPKQVITREIYGGMRIFSQYVWTQNKHLSRDVMYQVGFKWSDIFLT